VSHPSRKSLTTQLYFEGDSRNAADTLFKPSLMISPRRRGEILEGTFDVVLAAG
jgi:hypothetical protein